MPMSRAAGFDPRRMMISSPFSASAISRDRWAFASWVVTVFTKEQWAVAVDVVQPKATEVRSMRRRGEE
jgi:hypothetical protein